MQKPQPGLVRRIMRTYNKEILRDWRLSFTVMFSVVAGTVLIFYVPPLFIAAIIGSQERIDLSNGWMYILGFGLSWLGGEMLWRIAFFFMAKFESKAMHRLYSQTLETLLQKDVTFFNDRFAGSITKNALAYGRRFESYFDTLTFGVIAQVGPAIFGIIVLAIISPLLAITLVVIVTLVVVIVRPFIIRRSKLVKIREEYQATLSGHISDVVSNIASVKAYGAEKRELEINNYHTTNFTNAAYNSWHYHNTRCYDADFAVYRRCE